MAVVATRSAITLPVVGYSYAVTGLSTGTNTVTTADPGLDPSFVPTGLVVIQTVGSAGESQAVFSNWQVGQLAMVDGQLTFALWASSGADIDHVDVVVF